MRVPIAICLVILNVTAGWCAEQPDLESLLRQLKDDSAERRAHAARAIGDLRPKATTAVPALVLALKDANADVSVAAAYSLGDLGPDAKTAVPALVAALSDTRKASWGSVPGGPATVDSAAWFALHEIGSHAATAVAPFLESKSSEHRALAAWVISAAGGGAEPFVPKILALLSDDDQEVQYAAIDALGEMTLAPDATIPALITALDNEDITVRIRAAVAISKHGSAASRAVAALTEQLRHDNSTLRGFAAYSLGRLGAAARPALPELRRLAEDDGTVFNNLTPEHGWSEPVREWANAAVQRIESSKAPNDR